MTYRRVSISAGISRPSRLRLESLCRVSRAFGYRNASDTPSPPRQDGDEPSSIEQAEGSQGAMSRRLAQMSEEAIEQGGKGARNIVEEATFSEELKRQLEEKIASATFKSENASALAQANLPLSAGKHIRETAAAEPWTGTESLQDASLRMLNDARKPLRAPRTVTPPPIRGPPSKVDTGRPSGGGQTGVRLANARDRTSIYAFTKDPGLSDEERDKFRAQMKQRFQPGARSLPATLQGLASLANERIEDAIARGQFKNLPRGQKIERDHNANSPFINTTEYFMNKMIQKQDIVPPWIEKQQEVTATATKFRTRLRADWKRHVARTIASRGGTLENQIRLAEEYAYAESLQNPKGGKAALASTTQQSDAATQISLAGELRVPNAREDLSISHDDAELAEMAMEAEKALQEAGLLDTLDLETTSSAEQPPSADIPDPLPLRQPTVPPFRDPEWERTEKSYHSMAIENLNSLTRSYNLMAPNLAKKPYFSLERELRSCFADVAPLVAGAIHERAFKPAVQDAPSLAQSASGVLEKFAIDRAGHVYDERRPQYGFREFWRDLFASKKDAR